jgi:hypothetical protein
MLDGKKLDYVSANMSYRYIRVFAGDQEYRISTTELLRILQSNKYDLNQKQRYEHLTLKEDNA